MNKEMPYREQAEKAKKKIEKLSETALDEANLPPRSRVHRTRKKNAKAKYHFSLIRLLVLFFILLPIVVISVYTYLGFNPFKSDKVSLTPDKGYETVNYKTSGKAGNQKK